MQHENGNRKAMCITGQNFAGRVLVEDIGIPDEAYIEAETHA